MNLLKAVPAGNRKPWQPRAPQPIVVDTCTAHCGCGWGAANQDAVNIVTQAQAHSTETGHICHFQGQVGAAAKAAIRTALPRSFRVLEGGAE